MRVTKEPLSGSPERQSRRVIVAKGRRALPAGAPWCVSGRQREGQGAPGELADDDRGTVL